MLDLKRNADLHQRTNAYREILLTIAILSLNALKKLSSKYV